jgi:AcrR family transcriptional regulator
MTDGCDGDAADGETTDGGWTDAEEEIMLATYRALLEHGYAGLSISRIADELGKSKASIYYHYDSKEDLLGAFLAYAADRFQSSVLTEADDDPRAELERVVETLLPLRPDEEMRQIQAVFLGLRGQAVTNGTFREQFTEIDDQLAATIRGIVERGIEEGTFRDVDADRVAEHVLATINGAMYGRATSDRETAVAAVRVSLSSYLDAELRRQS